MISTKLHKTPFLQLTDSLRLLVDTLYRDVRVKPILQNLEGCLGVIVASKNNELCGFVCLFENTHYQENLQLGNYQCIDNDEVAKALFEEASRFASGGGYSYLLGPMHGSTWFSYRFSQTVDGPFFLEYIHKGYYTQQWEQNGFALHEKYQTNIESLDTGRDYDVYQPFLDKKGLVVKPFDLSNSEKELRAIHGFCNRLFSNNVLFSPIEEGAFLALYQPLLPYFKPDFISLVYDQQRLVGLFFAIPDVYNTEQIIVKTVARDPDPKYKGLAHIMGAHFCHHALLNGFKYMVHAYFHLDNRSSSLSNNYGGKKLRSHVLLKRPVE